ncbi:MAG: M28 family peptidase [Armatimonadota bacterium]
MRRWLAAALLAIAGLLGAPPLLGAGRAFDAGRAYRDLVRQCEFGPRVPGTESHAQCGLWLAKKLRECGAEVQIQALLVTLDERPVQLTNVVATFNPKGKKHVLLCGHWDTRPKADRDPSVANRQSPVPGANDGASGVAVLLEVARALKAQPPKGRVTIALFDGEDYGPTADRMFLGSRQFAKSYKGPKVSWGVLLDMVGDRELRIPIEQASEKSAPAVVERVWRAAARAGSTAFVRERGQAVMDDHVFLLREGIPCIDVIDFDYPYWHTTADTPDKCSAESLGQVGRAILAALADDGV